MWNMLVHPLSYTPQLEHWKQVHIIFTQYKIKVLWVYEFPKQTNQKQQLFSVFI